MIFTLGHSTLRLGEINKLAIDSGIDQIWDIRSHPGSSKWPWLNRDALQQFFGDRYLWEPGLGGWRKDHEHLQPEFPEVPLAEYGKSKFPLHRVAKELKNESGRPAWTVAGFWDFQFFMTLPEFFAAADHLVAAAKDRNIAIMCSELQWWRCHRAMVADYLGAHGEEVWHLQPVLTEHEMSKRLPRYCPQVLDAWSAQGQGDRGKEDGRMTDEITRTGNNEGQYWDEVAKEETKVSSYGQPKGRGAVASSSPEAGYDTVNGVREIPVRSVTPGGRFQLVLTTGRRITGTVVRHGMGSSAVVLDGAERERAFQTMEGKEIRIHTSGGIIYWSSGTAVLPLEGRKDISRWTSKGGTGVGLKPGLRPDRHQERNKKGNATGPAVNASNLEAGEITNSKDKGEQIMATTKAGRAVGLPGIRKAGSKSKTAKSKAANGKAANGELHPCLCGCGEKVTGRFRQGHDGRYYGQIRKVVNEEATFDSLNAFMRANLKNEAGCKAALRGHG